LITGGLGFIGSNLAHECVAQGADVTLFDCLDPHSGANRYNIRGIESAVRLLQHNILDFEKISAAVPGQDVIINCAASTSHPFSMADPFTDVDVNSKGVINLLEAIRRHSPTVRLVHMGTTTQLGRLQYWPADENHPEFPRDIYSANKCASEKYVLIYAGAYGLRATVLRLSNVFGPRAIIRSPEFTFNNYFIGLALQDKDITVYGEGTQKRNVIYVRDVVSAVLSTCRSDVTVNATFFVSGEEHYSISQIAQATVEHIGKGRVVHVDWPAERKAIELGDQIISNERMKRATDWQPTWPLAKGLEETGDYYGACLEQYLAELK